VLRIPIIDFTAVQAKTRLKQVCYLTTRKKLTQLFNAEEKTANRKKLNTTIKLQKTNFYL